MSATTTVDEVAVNRITARGDLIHGWAVLMWDDRGVVTLHTDHGSWVHQWHPRNIGASSIAAFLAGLNSGYASGKFMGQACRVTDFERTVAEAKKQLLEMRRDGDVEADDAREEWDLLKGVHEEHGLTEWVRASNIPDAWEHICTQQDPQWKAMWERLWVPHLRPALERLAKVPGVVTP